MNLPDGKSIKWKCGQCGGWSSGGVCKQCGAVLGLSVVKLDNDNTTIEKDYYNLTAPATLAILRNVYECLLSLKEVLYGINDEIKNRIRHIDN